MEGYDTATDDRKFVTDRKFRRDLDTLIHLRFVNHTVNATVGPYLGLTEDGIRALVAIDADWSHFWWSFLSAIISGVVSGVLAGAILSGILRSCTG